MDAENRNSSRAGEQQKSWRHRCRSRRIFGGTKDFCPNFHKLARKAKSFQATFCSTIFSHTDHEDFFWNDLQRHFFKSNKVGRHFGRIFRTFAQILWDFVNIFNDFAQIFTDFVPIFGDLVKIFDTWKHLRVRLHLLHPRLLHHWLKTMKSLNSFYFHIQYTYI